MFVDQGIRQFSAPIYHKNLVSAVWWVRQLHSEFLWIILALKQRFAPTWIFRDERAASCSLLLCKYYCSNIMIYIGRSLEHPLWSHCPVSTPYNGHVQPCYIWARPVPIPDLVHCVVLTVLSSKGQWKHISILLWVRSKVASQQIF